MNEITPRALSQLSDLASHPQVDKSQIAALVAKTQFLLGRYEESAEQYRAASDMAEESDWFVPALGEIRSLLKAQALERVQQRAVEIEKLAIEKFAQFEALANTTVSQLQSLGSLRVGARPVRPAVALTRLGVTFWQEGYLEEVKKFFEVVIAQTANGASRARQFLAGICLREQQFDRAEQLARESLQMGKFQAKTVASWPILLKARFAQKKALLDAPLYQGLLTHQSGPLCARSVLLIAKELRSYGGSLGKGGPRLAGDALAGRSRYASRNPQDLPLRSKSYLTFARVDFANLLGTPRRSLAHRERKHRSRKDDDRIRAAQRSRLHARGVAPDPATIRSGHRRASGSCDGTRCDEGRSIRNRVHAFKRTIATSRFRTMGQRSLGAREDGKRPRSLCRGG